MVRFATTDDYQWIHDLIVEAYPIHRSCMLDTLEAQIEAKQVIIEDEEHSAASFIPHDDYLEIVFNTTNPAYSDVLTSSGVLGTYLLYKFRVPFRFYTLQSRAEAYWETKHEYIKTHTELLGTEEIEGNIYNLYEYTYGGLQ